jgi:hypothetical protein
MTENDEVVDSRVLIRLEFLFKQLPFPVVAEFEEQLAGHTDELLVRVVGRPFVLLFPLVDSVDLLLNRILEMRVVHACI